MGARSLMGAAGVLSLVLLALQPQPATPIPQPASCPRGSIPHGTGADQVCICKPTFRCRGSCTPQPLLQRGCYGQVLESFPLACGGQPSCEGWCRPMPEQATKAQLEAQWQNAPASARNAPLGARQGPACDELYPGFCGPFAIIAGADKCGTNALAAYLELFPGLTTALPNHARARQCLAAGWSGEVNFDFWRHTQKTVGRAYAESLYNLDWQRTFHVDKSTSYFSRGPDVAPHLRRLLPRSKVLIVLCDPARRVWSRFNQYNKRDWGDMSECAMFQADWHLTLLEQLRILVSRNQTAENFDEGRCNRLLGRWRGRPGVQRFEQQCNNICDALHNGIYTRFLGPWDRLGRQTLVLSNHDLKVRPRLSMQRVLRHLGLPWPAYDFRNLGLVHSVQSGTSSGQSYHNVKEMDGESATFREAMALLGQFYRHEIIKLYRRGVHLTSH